MKNIKKIIIIVALLILLLYVCNVTLLPNNYILVQGEKLNIRTLAGLSLQTTANSSIQASSNLTKNKIDEVGKLDLSISLFDIIKLKDITVNVIPKTSVIPIGASIGMKLYTDGVLVVGMSEIEGQKPYENKDIQEGDRIIQISNQSIKNTSDLMEVVKMSNGKELQVTYVREDTTKTTSIKPVKTNQNEYKLGLWVRDAAAGVGTITFYEPSSKMFATLGHGITDVDTSELIKIANGKLVTTNILAITKGEKGKPGEIRGTIESGYEIGEISKNTAFGVYGTLNNTSSLHINNSEAMEVALREEVKLGKAEIICQLEEGKKEHYEIEIQKIFANNNQNNKSMMIKVIDKELLEKTGGIIQGMSGAPILQNGKFIGAVTHVLVNDPTSGYAVFGDMMIKQMKEVND